MRRETVGGRASVRLQTDQGPASKIGSFVLKTQSLELFPGQNLKTLRRSFQRRRVSRDQSFQHCIFMAIPDCYVNLVWVNETSPSRFS